MPLVQLDDLDSAARLVGDRWSLLVLGALLDGDRRYGELLEEIEGISTNVLAQRLAALEAAGLVVAEPYVRRPPRMRYSLTNDGRGLADALAALSAWGAERSADGGEFRLRHAACGTPLEARWHCPACDVDVDLQAHGSDATVDDAITFNA
jgi:DNA-binding HxlR family transcriptional regulator